MKKLIMKKPTMKKPKRLLPPMAIYGLFALAVVMLFSSSIGGARAALTYYSETYSSRVQMYSIGVSLLENGNPVSWRNYDSAGNGKWDEETGELLTGLLSDGESLTPGKTYREELCVENTGSINQYVRVRIYKYWVDSVDGKDDKSSERLRTLSPDMIDLHLVNLGTDWIEDTQASTEERTVLYYNKVLPAEAGEASRTSLFADQLTIDGELAKKVSQTESANGKYTTITTTYLYNGVKFVVKAEVDAVQEHNAEDAILSAWGRKVSVDGGTLRLVD